MKFALIRQYCQEEFIWSGSQELLLLLALLYFTLQSLQ